MKKHKEKLEQTKLFKKSKLFNQITVVLDIYVKIYFNAATQ